MIEEAWPPEHAEFLLHFEVRGMPRPAGSKNAMPLGRRVEGRFVPYTREDGTPIVNVTDSSGEHGKNWRSDIRQAVGEELARRLDGQRHELVDGPVAVRVTFTYPGPRSRYGTGRNAGVLKDSAPAFPHAGELADGSKLTRALEDALTGALWTDDRRVCDCWWSRRFHGVAGARVSVYRLPVTVAELRGSVLVEDAEPGDQLALGADDRSVIIDGDVNADQTEAVAV